MMCAKNGLPPAHQAPGAPKGGISGDIKGDLREDPANEKRVHLGEHMSVRLPSAAPYALQVAKEHRWLPKLAPLLPLPIPMPLALGDPADGYPWPWSVCRWLEGEPATLERIADLSEFATALAQILICPAADRSRRRHAALGINVAGAAI